MIQSHILHHLARRGVEAVSAPQDELYIQQLKTAAMAYEGAGPEMSVTPIECVGPVLTVIAFMLMMATIRYTIGEVVATLAMIEQPQTTIVESSTTNIDESDPDAPLEKGRLVDEEVIVIKQDIITSSIKGTIKYLDRVGGAWARWRGLGAAMAYHLAHSLAVNLISTFFGSFPPFRAVAYIVSSVLLSKIHMTWTHVMISHPSDKPWYRRIPQDRKIWKALVLPSFVYAVAEILTIALPVLMAVSYSPAASRDMSELRDFLPIIIQVTIGAVTMLAVSVLILLPASVTLTRIEASFLPDDQETIVAFDRTFNGAVGAAASIDGPSHKSLFIEAWRSFDMASRVRLIKFYIKMSMLQVSVVLFGGVIFTSQVYALGPERLKILVQAGSAQLQLAAMGVSQD
ncbi:hypothetical protein MBLNU459_g0055t1 [Dothideomycetes sp. NU459]